MPVHQYSLQYLPTKSRKQSDVCFSVNRELYFTPASNSIACTVYFRTKKPKNNVGAASMMFNVLN